MSEHCLARWCVPVNAHREGWLTGGWPQNELPVVDGACIFVGTLWQAGILPLIQRHIYKAYAVSVVCAHRVSDLFGLAAACMVLCRP